LYNVYVNSIAQVFFSRKRR